MKELANNILAQIEVDISEIDLYGYDIIETSLSMVHKLQTVLDELRVKIQTYIFPTKEDEILFFKTKKPELLGRLLFFYKIYKIETQCPNGSDEVIRNYINRELDNLTYFFNRNLDFYQYYRSHSTVYDEYYFVRGKADLRLCTDSAQFDKDPNFSTGYDYKVAKIIANEMLRIYLNKRLVKLVTNNQIEDNLQRCFKYPFRFTGKKSYLIELGYSLVSSGDINNGNVEIKEMMNFLSTIFHIDLGDYYASYIAMKEEKITWTKIHCSLAAGVVLFFLNWWMLELPLPHTADAVFYIATLSAGYICMLMAGTWMSRLLKNNLMDDIFNTENESFQQETRLIENEYSVNLPTRFYYKKKWNNGWINVVNPFRASLVLGTPGSGKSYAVVNSYIKQQIEKGFALYCYDYKFPDLSEITYNHLLNHLDGYKVKPKFYIINFDDPRKSHRCNPINASFMSDIADAYEASYTIMLNLNRSWISKQGDFFVESPIILLAAIIWYLRIYNTSVNFYRKI